MVDRSRSKRDRSAMASYGYARVSSTDQDLALQQAALKELVLEFGTAG